MKRRSLLSLVPGLPILLSGEPLFSQSPPPQTSAEPDIQKMIDDAYKSGQKHVTIPAGTYHLTPPKGEGTHLHLRKMSDFTVDATGVHLILAANTLGGIEMNDCHNVQIQGFTLQAAIPPFTQGTVVNIAPGIASIDVQIDDGYPLNLTDTQHFAPALDGYFYDPKTRNLKANAFDLRGRVMETLTPQRFRISAKAGSSNPQAPITVGELIAFRGLAAHHCILNLNCSNLVFKNVVVYTSSVFGFIEVNGDGGNQYLGVQVRRGPRWAEAKADPLLSSCADAFHSSNMRKGPIVDNCHFEGMGDDGIAINGAYDLVLKADDTRLTVNRSFFRPGDPILLFDANDIPAGEAVVKQVNPLPNFQNSQTSARFGANPDLAKRNMQGPYTELVLDQKLNAGFDFICSNPAQIGSGYEIRNTTISNHRARAMLLKAHNGMVENNTIDGSSMAGIVLMPEPTWNEACYSRNVTIRNNKIKNVAFAPNPSGGIIVAALTKAPVTGFGHKNITIEGNTIDSVNGVNLLVTSAENVTISDNHFTNPQRKEVVSGGSAWGEDPGSLVHITASRNVKVKGNRVSGAGPLHQRLLHADPDVDLHDSDWKNDSSAIRTSR